MTKPNFLSDYDKDIIKKIKESKLLIIDLDGTLIDFEKIDNIIIAHLFPDNKVINSIDNILWKINRLDVFGNGYAGLKLRLAFYSLFSKYTFKECKKIYGNMYEKLARHELFDVCGTTLTEILNNGYDIAIVTKNVYAKKLLDRRNILDKETRKRINLIVLKKDKKKKFREMVKQYNSKVCVIGNNLSDDIMSSFKIGSPYIYIGKSKMINFIISFNNKFSKNKGVQFRKIKNIKSLFVD